MVSTDKHDKPHGILSIFFGMFTVKGSSVTFIPEYFIFIPTFNWGRKTLMVMSRYCQR